MTFLSEQDKRERAKEPHPVWRGIGFLLIVGIPFLAYGISIQMLTYFAENGIAIPEQLKKPALDIPVLGTVNNWPAVVAFTILGVLVLYGLFAVVNAIIYSSSSANTYRIFESKPAKFKKKRKLVKPDYEK